MNRREAVAAFGALALTACGDAGITAALAHEPLNHGAYVHCGFRTPRPEYGKVPGTQCPWPRPWDAMKTEDRVPAWGEYDEGERWVTEERCRLMEFGGINFAVYQIDTNYLAMRKAA